MTKTTKNPQPAMSISTPAADTLPVKAEGLSPCAQYGQYVASSGTFLPHFGQDEPISKKSLCIRIKAW